MKWIFVNIFVIVLCTFGSISVQAAAVSDEFATKDYSTRSEISSETSANVEHIVSDLTIEDSASFPTQTKLTDVSTLDSVWTISLAEASSSTTIKDLYREVETTNEALNPEDEHLANLIYYENTPDNDTYDAPYSHEEPTNSSHFVQTEDTHTPVFYEVTEETEYKSAYPMDEITDVLTALLKDHSEPAIYSELRSEEAEGVNEELHTDGEATLSPAEGYVNTAEYEENIGGKAEEMIVLSTDDFAAHEALNETTSMSSTDISQEYRASESWHTMKEAMQAAETKTTTAESDKDAKYDDKVSGKDRLKRQQVAYSNQYSQAVQYNQNRQQPASYYSLFDLCPPLVDACPLHVLPTDVCSYPIVLKLVLLSPPQIDYSRRVCGKFAKLASYGAVTSREFRTLLRFSVKDGCGCHFKPASQYMVLSRLSAFYRDGAIYNKFSLSDQAILIKTDRYSEQDVLNRVRACYNNAQPLADPGAYGLSQPIYQPPPPSPYSPSQPPMPYVPPQQPNYEPAQPPPPVYAPPQPAPLVYTPPQPAPPIYAPPQPAPPVYAPPPQPAPPVYAPPQPAPPVYAPPVYAAPPPAPPVYAPPVYAPPQPAPPVYALPQPAPPVYTPPQQANYAPPQNLPLIYTPPQYANQQPPNYEIPPSPIAEPPVPQPTYSLPAAVAPPQQYPALQANIPDPPASFVQYREQQSVYSQPPPPQNYVEMPKINSPSSYPAPASLYYNTVSNAPSPGYAPPLAYIPPPPPVYPPTEAPEIYAPQLSPAPYVMPQTPVPYSNSPLAETYVPPSPPA